MDKHQHLQQWKNIQSIMQSESLDYCFRHYSDFTEISDNQFHAWRTLLLHSMERLEDIVQHNIEKLSEESDDIDYYELD